MSKTLRQEVEHLLECMQEEKEHALKCAKHSCPYDEAPEYRERADVYGEVADLLQAILRNQVVTGPTESGRISFGNPGVSITEEG